ncbi:hypothetical protein L596_021539 [Steinernema carpocapsae]|uniref:CWH43-like N-terminal domain-containing protein n=1 Tax=Steinernema carpocapsae TaxID=34508 RepID=A0A4U5MJ28_STECR|nr:hypothetical protein L596_021539 [Steinernema carpocapsae]
MKVTSSTTAFSTSSDVGEPKKTVRLLGSVTSKAYVVATVAPVIVALLLSFAVGFAFDYGTLLNYEWTCGKALLPSISRVINLPKERTICNLVLIGHVFLRPMFTLHYFYSSRTTGRLPRAPSGIKLFCLPSERRAGAVWPVLFFKHQKGPKKGQGQAGAGCLERIIRSTEFRRIFLQCPPNSGRNDRPISLTNDTKSVVDLQRKCVIQLFSKYCWQACPSVIYRENSQLHVTFFCLFCCSCNVYFVIVTLMFRTSHFYTWHKNASLSFKLKAALVIINFILLPTTSLFFVLYWQLCVSFAYDVFAILEYTTVIIIITFHMTAVLDFDYRYAFVISK